MLLGIGYLVKGTDLVLSASFVTNILRYLYFWILTIVPGARVNKTNSIYSAGQNKWHKAKLAFLAFFWYFGLAIVKIDICTYI